MNYDQLAKVVDALQNGVLIQYPPKNLDDLPVLIAAEETGNDIVLSIVASAITKMSKAYMEALEILEKELKSMQDDDYHDFHDEERGDYDDCNASLNLKHMVNLANILDSSDDPALQKYASVLDQILLTMAAPKAKIAAELAQEKEVEKLREKYREQAIEDNYKKPHEKHDEKIKAADAVKAIKDSIKQYRPLEAPLSTRTCPEHPGAPLQRVGEYVYQCSMDKKVYDFRAGYTSLKGNVVPGGDVSQQTQSMGDRAPDHMTFETRESKLNG